MRRAALIFSLLLAALVARAQPGMVFERIEEQVGGIVKKAGTVTREYAFINAGDEPLVILDAQGACDCTKITYPKNPVMPGQAGVVTVQYNPRKQPLGKVYKAIRVFTNEPEGRHILIFAGEVI